MSLLKNYRLVLIIVCLLLVCGLALYSYVYQKEEPMSEQSISFEGDYASFIKANVKENSVVVLKEARVTSVLELGVKLERDIIIQYTENESLNFKGTSVGDIIAIKGDYVGYDDLLEEHKLINCIILKDE
jgi:hypothetical protein